MPISELIPIVLPQATSWVILLAVMWLFRMTTLNMYLLYKNILGGRLTSYESIVERARREAIVRLKQQAQSVGANHIMGVRLSTTELGMQGGMVEVFAYGTAVKD